MCIRDSPVGGHKTISKTISSNRRHFIWKGMDRDIATHVKACHLCGLSKPAQNTKLGLLSSDVASKPMEKLFIDYVGPFPRSKSGNAYLLVCVDAFSKFVWLTTGPYDRQTLAQPFLCYRPMFFSISVFRPPLSLTMDHSSFRMISGECVSLTASNM